MVLARGPSPEIGGEAGAAGGATAGEAVHAAGRGRSGRRAHGPSRRRTLIAFVLGAAVLVAVPLVASRLVDHGEPAAHVFEIPPGTAARLAAGEDVDVLPADLRIPLRDRLVVVNHDVRAHQVGPFTVEPGATLDRRFSEAASISGFCSLHAGGRITIDVRPEE